MTDLVDARPYIRRRVVLVPLALLVLGAASMALYVAAWLDWAVCNVESSVACESRGLGRLQLVVAAAAVVPAIVLAGALIARKRRTGILALALSVILYGTWAFLVAAA
jgi:hypothetical protein